MSTLLHRSPCSYREVSPLSISCVDNRLANIDNPENVRAFESPQTNPTGGLSYECEMAGNDVSDGRKWLPRQIHQRALKRRVMQLMDGPLHSVTACTARFYSFFQNSYYLLFITLYDSIQIPKGIQQGNKKKYSENTKRFAHALYQGTKVFFFKPNLCRILTRLVTWHRT